MTSELSPAGANGVTVPVTQKWIALELAETNSIKALVGNPDFRTGVGALGRDQALLSESNRLGAIFLLLQIEKTGRDGRLMADGVLKQVISSPPASFRALRNEKDQSVFVQRLSTKSIGWLVDYFAVESWRSGIGKKALVAAVVTVLRKSETWADAIGALALRGMSLAVKGEGSVTAAGVELMLQGIATGIESSTTLPGEDFFQQLGRLFATWEQISSKFGGSSKSATLFTHFIHLIRVAVACRPVLLQQSGLAEFVQRIRQRFCAPGWSSSAEVELRKLRILVGDRIVIDVEHGVANLELFGALEALCAKRSEAMLLTARLAAVVTAAPGYLLEWMKTGDLEVPHEGVAGDDYIRRLAALYVRGTAMRQALAARSGDDGISEIQAMCIEIEQMANLHGLELIGRSGDEVDYLPLRHRYREAPTRRSTRVKIEVPAVGRRGENESSAKIILPALVREV